MGSSFSSPPTSMPPLPSLPTSGGSTPGTNSDPSPLAAMLSGLGPIKSAVDQIRQACQAIVQSGTPGAEQICGQIIALSSAIPVMALQHSMGQQSGGAPGGPGQSSPSMPPPPPPGGSGQPILGQGQ